MAANMRDFLNGLAKGAQYIPDILQDIAIQRQRQQQLDLGEKQFGLTKQIYEEGAPLREAQLEEVKAGTAKALSGVELDKAAKTLAEIQNEIIIATKEYTIKTAQYTSEGAKYQSDKAKFDIDNAQKILDSTLAELKARLDNLHAEGANLALQHESDSMKLTMDAIIVGSYIKDNPEIGAKLENLKFTDWKQMLATVSKIDFPKPFINSLTGIGNKILEIEQNKEMFVANKYKEGLALYKGDQKKAILYRDAESKAWDERYKYFFQNIYGYDYDPRNPTGTPTDLGLPVGPPAPPNLNWQQNPQLQGGGVDVSGIYEEFKKPLSIGIGTQP